MAVEAPSKTDIEAIFKRLRSIPSNKTCFDCGAKNPTWSTVTFGVFICIDCSSVHRNLGVHLTFVRSTQLDTQWTWVQLRSMQLGGNANAATFFRQHNCTTVDAQTKYNSRAAMLYKEKLSNLAVQSLRIHGTEPHIDSGTEAVASQEKKEEDFFAVTEAFPGTTSVNTNGSFMPRSVAAEPVNPKEADPECQGAGPNIAVITNSPTPAAEPKVAKSLIGQRKPATKKSGMMGAKKGLGATKVHTNFEEIEKEAHLADSMRSQKNVDIKVEETESQTNSLRLAYQDLSLESKKQSERLQKVDPSKAQQVERLGMGIMAANSGPRNISHSAISDMVIIQQDSPAFTSSNASFLASMDRKTFTVAEESSNSFYSKNSGLDDLLTRGGSSKSSRDSDWDMLSDFAPVSKSSQGVAAFGGAASSNSNYGSSTANSGKSSSSTYGSSTKTKDYSSAGSDSGEAQKKFGGAKAISSDQYFQDSGSADQERRSNLSRFQGSSGISSSDYFGTGDSNTGRSKNSSGPAYNIQTPDLDEVKESVRQGVTKVASKLSSLANDFASSIQDRYGY